MYKFATIVAGKHKQVDNIYDETDRYIGVVGYDEEGLYLNLKSRLQLLDMITLLEQIEGGSLSNGLREIEINYIKD